MIETSSGAKIHANIKDGWRAKLIGENILLTNPDHPAYFIDLATVKEGDELPRDSDTAVSFPPRVGGK